MFQRAVTAVTTAVKEDRYWKSQVLLSSCGCCSEARGPVEGQQSVGEVDHTLHQTDETPPEPPLHHDSQSLYN